MLPEDAVVLLVAEPRSLYINRRVVVEDSYRLPLLLELAAGATSPHELAERVTSLGVTHLLVNEGHMTWSAHLRGVDDYWDGGAPGARTTVQQFLTHSVDRVFQQGDVWIARVDPDPAAPR